MTDPRKREIKARMKARPGETYMQARRRLSADPATLGTVGFVFSTSLPNQPADTYMVPVEKFLAAVIANSARLLTRTATGERYPAAADVAVLRPQRPARPDEAPPGWRPVEAFVLVRARRPWDALDEDEQVITDAYQAARDTVTDIWPDLPEDWKPAAMNLETVAALRGWDIDTLKQRAADPLGHSVTVRPDPTLLTEEDLRA